jgi:hypothetical protein
MFENVDILSVDQLLRFIEVLCSPNANIKEFARGASYGTAQLESY